MLVGYARTSTADQVAGLEAQRRDLEAAGATKIFSEHISATAKRNALEECLRFVREGDTLMVTKPDRLARSTADLLAIQTPPKAWCRPGHPEYGIGHQRQWQQSDDSTATHYPRSSLTVRA